MKDTLYGELSVIGMRGCEDFVSQVDYYLQEWRRHDTDGTFVINSSCPRFGSGEAKGTVHHSLRGNDVYIICDVFNHGVTYNMYGQTVPMSPDDHFQDLKRIIGAIGGKARRISVIMPMLYEGRQHKRSGRESLDCATALQDLEAMGVKEINLIAQDTTRYGLDLYGEYSLARLVREITKETTIPWIRLLYCYPDKITDELIHELRNNDRLLKYMDIPVQHIADPVLKRMNRHGGKSLIIDAIKRLREGVPGIILRTTAMVGFPGETDEDFTELCEFVKDTRFDRFGAFTFSPEEGTAAAEMDGQIDEQVKQDRYDCLMQTQLTVAEEKTAERVGSVLTVLCEGYDRISEVYHGRSFADAPDVDGRVYFKSTRVVAAGEFVDVHITEALDYDLVGEAVV